MQQGQPSRTALRVAMRRAAHQLLDDPLVFEDPYALQILPPEAVANLQESPRAEHPFARALRAFMAARSRFAEDELARAVQLGVRQYLLLGAGLDTFAWRNPYVLEGIIIFEVDHPATQVWKRALLRDRGLPEPAVRYVPVDFEHESLPECLRRAGFAADQPAFCSWLGVVPYLTLESFRRTLDFFARMEPPSGLVFDYSLPRAAMSDRSKIAFDYLAARVALAGEPFRLFFRPSEVSAELARAGWRVNADLDGVAISERFFCNRADGLTVPGGAGRLVSACK